MIIDPTSGSSVSFSGTIIDSSNQSINWTAAVAGRMFSGTGKAPSFIWNGKDNNGQIVTNGTYEITLTVKTADGECTDSKSIPITVESSCDLEATITGPGNDLTFGTGGSYLLTGSYTTTSSQPVNWTLSLPNGSTQSGTGLPIGYIWDGTLSDGTLAPIGNYSAALTVTSSEDSNCNATAILPITIAPTTAANSCGLTVTFGSTAHVANGNLSHSQELFSSRGGVLPVGLNLYYNSRDSRNTSLGRGWSHSYDYSLTENSDGSVLISEPNWKYRSFSFSNGAYTAAPGNYATMVKNADGAFTLTHQDGQTYTFENGRLTAITDRNGNTATFTYTGNNLATVTDPAGRIIAFTYDSASHLTSVTDPAGNTFAFSVGDSLNSVTQPNGGAWQYTYDANSFMLTKTDSLGNVTTYAYDNQHRVISAIDPEGKSRSITYPQTSDTLKTTTFTEKDGGQWSYNYDTQNGYLLAKTDPQGGTTAYTYDANGNRTSTTNPDGTSTSSSYDSAGNMLASTDALGQTTSYTYNAYGQLTSITDPQGGTTGYVYDAKGNMTSLTDPTGAATMYDYDAKGNMTKVTNVAGQATTFTYDANGNLTSVTDPAGASTTYAYDVAGNVTSISDTKGALTQFVYDNRNRLITTIDPQGNVTLYRYDANGNKLSETDANDNTTTFEYNSRNQLIKNIDALGSVTTYAYGGSTCPSCGGGADKLTSITDANGNTIRYEYDELGRKVREVDSLGHAVSYTYDTKGNILTKTDALGRVTTFVYDPLNRIKEQLDPAGGKTLFEYSLKGQLTKVTDPVGVTTLYEYDAVGRNIRTSSSDSGVIAYTYNPVGTLKTKTDANGITVNYDYDATGRLAVIRYPEAAQNVTYTYDSCMNGKGKLCSMTDSSGATVYGYDTLGRIATEQKVVLGFTYTTAYSYDKVGNLTSSTYPSGRTVTYSHDKMNRTNSVTAKLKSTTILAGNVSYDPAGNLTSLNYGNGLTLSRSYESSNRIQTITLPGMINSTYRYDAVGNITAIAGGIDPSATKTYGYDQLDRLSSASGPWGGLVWTYDGNGNRLSQKNGTNYSYIYEGNRLQTITNGTTANYRYDDAGNTLSDGKKEFVYNQNNRLIKAVESGKTVGEYLYNGKGERVVKKTGLASTSSASSQNTVYHYDLAGRLIEETAGDGKLLVDYVYFDGNPLAMIRMQGNNEETFYFHNDHLGTPKVMSDKLGKVVWNIEFDPFGNEVQTKGRQGSYIRSVENNFRFPGQYFDLETGLHYNYFRDYDPKKGRYLEADPIGLRGGINLFVYTSGNPLSRIDPRGLAYFAYRPLGGIFGVFSVKGNEVDDKLNTYAAHEQLFFEDGKYPSNIGFFDDGTLKTEVNISKYQAPHSTGWNDCVMRKAIKKVTLNTYSLLGKLGPIEKFNCQDWAQSVRAEHNKIINDSAIAKECCIN